MNKLMNRGILSLLTGIIIILNFIIIGCGRADKRTTEMGRDTSGLKSTERTDTAGAMTRDTGMTKSAKKLMCTLMGTKESKVAGTLTFIQDGEKVRVSGTITGLTPGYHGFHIHETGDCSAPDFTSAGDHFNPNKGQHGEMDKKESHMGDMGNIKANKDGVAEIDETTEYMDLNQINGKAVVVHANEDDLKTQPAGNSGPRIGCGIIQIAK
jgi:superoxide dismutase, Cu-Zn family